MNIQVKQVLRCLNHRKFSGKCVEAGKTFRERLSQQEEMKSFKKLRSVGSEDPYELASLSWNDDPTIIPSISYHESNH